MPENSRLFLRMIYNVERKKENEKGRSNFPQKHARAFGWQNRERKGVPY